MNNQGDFSFRRSFFSISITFILMITMLAQSAWAAPSSADLKKEQSKKQGQLDEQAEKCCGQRSFFLYRTD